MPGAATGGSCDAPAAAARPRGFAGRARSRGPGRARPDRVPYRPTAPASAAPLRRVPAAAPPRARLSGRRRQLQLHAVRGPVIEPGDCIFWDATGGPHSWASDTCPDDGANSCANPAPPTCKWDTGNVTGPPSPNVDATCSFGASAFPADSQWGFYCRQHDNPNHNGVPGMSGTLKVSRLIVLSAIRSAAAASLSWTGGDGQFKVEIAANDRTFNTGRTTTDPIGGSAGTSYGDAMVPPAGTARYYLVRNKQTNET